MYKVDPMLETGEPCVTWSRVDHVWIKPGFRVNPNCVIQWIEIYPVNSAIQLLNNWGQVDKSYYNNNYNIVTIYTLNNSVVISKPTP